MVSQNIPMMLMKDQPGSIDYSLDGKNDEAPAGSCDKAIYRNRKPCRTASHYRFFDCRKSEGTHLRTARKSSNSSLAVNASYEGSRFEPEGRSLQDHLLTGPPGYAVHRIV